MNRRLVPMPTRKAAHQHVDATRQMDHAYYCSRAALLDCLNEGFVDAEPLKAMQAAMARMAQDRRAFGLERYHELRALLDEVEKLPVCEPVFVRHEPMFGEEHHRRMQPYRQVPYPYQFKWDGPWIFVLLLFAGGFAFPALWVIAGIIAFMRCLVWSSFRFPMTTIFFVSLFNGLLGGGRRRW